MSVSQIVAEQRITTVYPAREIYACIDSGGWQEVPDDFTWSLQAGMNVLQVRACNRAGVEGVTSSLSVVRAAGG